MRSSSHRGTVHVLGALGVFSLAGSTMGQSVMTQDSGWLLRPIGEYVTFADRLTQDVQIGPGTDRPTRQYELSSTFGVAGQPFGTQRMGHRAGSFNPNGTTNEYRYTLSYQRIFTIANENGTVFIPSLLNAVIGANRGGAGGFCGGSITGEAVLQRETTAGMGDWVNVGFANGEFYSLSSNGGLNNQEFNSNWDMDSFDITGGARRYRVITNLNVSGTVTLNTPLGAAVGTVATFGEADSASRGGFVTSLAVIPQGYNGNSREAIRAVQARNDFGVTGFAQNVGVLEGGQVYDQHGSLAGRVTWDGGLVANQRNEHTLAVASIIGSRSMNTSEAGVSPDVQIISTDPANFANTPAALNSAMAQSFVVNMSFGSPALTANVVDAAVNARPNVTLVIAADNTGTGQAPGTDRMTPPSKSWNAIHVGSLNRDFTRKAPFSSFNDTGTGPYITVVAPGEYINSASVGGGRGDNASNTFARVFTGNDFDKAGGAVTGDISGNSFAAPHVTGVVALMGEYSDFNPGFDASAYDGRVVRAIIANSASTQGIRQTTAAGAAGNAWSQTTNNGMATPASPLLVTRSLDAQLGAGMLDAANALRTLASGEVRLADNNTDQHFIIDGAAHLANSAMNPGRGQLYGRTGFWDMENVEAHNGMDPGMVDYLLGDLGTGQVRSTLTWDRDATRATPAALELSIWLEGVSANNMIGWDPLDFLLARTTATLTENVKLLDFIVPLIDITTLPGYDAEPPEDRAFFLQVRNMSNYDVTYGIVVQIPSPAGSGLLALAGVLALRRRRVT
ncbi:MAG: S8 family serine peptidase [Phycisphaerales bacterium]